MRESGLSFQETIVAKAEDLFQEKGPLHVFLYSLAMARNDKRGLSSINQAGVCRDFISHMVEAIFNLIIRNTGAVIVYGDQMVIGMNAD